MPTVEEYTDPYVSTYTYVPPAGPNVCENCHTAVEGTYHRCYSCSQSIAQVSRPARVVVPISLYRGLEQLHHVLRQYKDARTEEIRAPLQMQVAAILGRFLREHEGCISGGAGSYDFVTIVPSSGGRSDPHPLETSVGLVRNLASRFARTLQPGPVSISHNHASDRGFAVVHDVSGARVLLLDDTLTSGARVQSAASALYLAGAADVAVVAIGRFFKPDFSTTHRSLWDAARKRGFSFERCCLESDHTWNWSAGVAGASSQP